MFAINPAPDDKSSEVDAKKDTYEAVAEIHPHPVVV